MRKLGNGDLMSKQEDRRWRWWVLLALVLGFVAGFFILRTGTDSLPLENSARAHKQFPQQAAPVLPQHGRVERPRRSGSQPQIDLGDGK
ncbi:MAG TPA: hypothetical protein VG963_27435 [Polyangiaceae bacterium]|nr:hypothetical protein [Polyangiaceae bacterium]